MGHNQHTFQPLNSLHEKFLRKVQINEKLTDSTFAMIGKFMRKHYNRQLQKN